jgi:very-short-patch-repair endonuclease
MPFIKTSYRNDFYYGATKELIEFAKELRQRQTEAEKVLWKALRNKRFSGVKFRRQHPIITFIADFYCHELKLVIEVDGGVHQLTSQAEYDEGRSAEIENLGILVIRFSNEEILRNLDSVLQKINKTILQRSSPSPGGEGVGGVRYLSPGGEGVGV